MDCSAEHPPPVKCGQKGNVWAWELEDGVWTLVCLWHSGSSSFWSVVSCGDALSLRRMVMKWWILRMATGKIKTLGSWVSDLRNPALLLTEMLGGGEFSVNCLHGEQMFNNRLLSWADYDTMHLRLNKSRLEIQHNLAVRVNDHWNSFTKACAIWAVTSTFRSPDNNSIPEKCCHSNGNEFVKALCLLLSVRSVSPHTLVRSGLLFR